MRDITAGVWLNIANQAEYDQVLRSGPPDLKGISPTPVGFAATYAGPGLYCFVATDTGGGYYHELLADAVAYDQLLDTLNRAAQAFVQRNKLKHGIDLKCNFTPTDAQNCTAEDLRQPNKGVCPNCGHGSWENYWGADGHNARCTKCLKTFRFSTDILSA